MNTNLDANNENLNLQTTPAPTLYVLGALFTAGVVIGSIFGTIITKTKER